MNNDKDCRTSQFHVLHEAADRLDHYLDTYEPSTAARIAGHQLSDELRKIAEDNA